MYHGYYEEIVRTVFCRFLSRFFRGNSLQSSTYEAFTQRAFDAFVKAQSLVSSIGLCANFCHSIIQFLLICPTSALEKIFNPQNMLYIPPVKNCFRLEFEQIP